MSSRLLLALAIALAGSAALLDQRYPASEKSPLASLRPVAPSLKGEVHPPKDYEVFEWALGKQRQRVRKAVAARALYSFGTTWYVEEAGSKRWLVGHPPRRGEKVIECEQTFGSLRALLDASAFAPLPRPPAGFSLREVVRLPNHPTRLASDGSGKVLYVLCGNGDVWLVEIASGKQRLILRGEDYADRACVSRLLLGMALDGKGRLYLAANERDDRPKLVTNRVTIYRTTKTVDGVPADPKPWLSTSYPWGIGPFNHGVGHMAFGPDGHLYVNSGSRTDGNEPGDDPRYSKGGETDLTACLWRIDTAAREPKVEVYARGLRNAYGFCWNDRGEMIATENGPDADPAEELNLIEKGGHYGFPYVFSDWAKKPYRHTPDAPKGLKFTAPIVNLGPAGGGSAKKPLSTFDAHSSPSGIVFLGDDFPKPYRGGYFVARFGNLLDRPRVGFDLLHVALKKNKQRAYEARTTAALAPVARPVDLHLAGKGRVYICEYSRQTDNKGYAGMLPGRVLELAADR